MEQFSLSLLLSYIFFYLKNIFGVLQLILVGTAETCVDKLK